MVNVDELRNFMSVFAEALLVIALPIVIAAAIQHFRVMTQRYYGTLSEGQQQALNRAVQIAVQVAEQSGVLEGLIGPEKRQRAVEVAQSFLKERGVKIDMNRLVSLIEAEVATQFNNPSLPADTLQARQELIDKAVEAAVLAAEQSGYRGHIQNTAAEKKAYAMRLIKLYLDEHNITIHDELASGLIEAQLLRLALAARSR
jgi:hypothetical protein